MKEKTMDKAISKMFKDLERVSQDDEQMHNAIKSLFAQMGEEVKKEEAIKHRIMGCKCQQCNLDRMNIEYNKMDKRLGEITKL